MDRSRAAALLLVAAAAVWLSRPADPPADGRAAVAIPAAAPGARPTARTDLVAAALRAEQPRPARRPLRPVGSGRAPEPEADSAPRPPSAAPRPVAVRGRAWFGIQPAEGVTIAVVDAAGDEVDWDFADEDGRFELRLAPGTYRFVHDDLDGWSVELVVPDGRAGRLEVALSLPTALLDDAVDPRP